MTFEPLREAVAAQYAAFRAPSPRAVQGCSCCTTHEQLAGLVAWPREELGSRDLDFYARKAMTTVGTVDDFRYFWPRVAELAIRGELQTDTEIVFGKPARGAHHLWPVEERDAIEHLASAIGLWMGREERDAGDVDTWVCSIGLLAQRLADPRGFLAPLLADSEPAWANLRGLVDWNLRYVREKRRLANAFWENAPESALLVLDWITTEPRAIEAARALDRESAARYGTSPAVS